MTDLPAATIAAADFYDRHYAGAEPIFLEPGMKLMLGSGERPRYCRFCGKDEPTVTFKDEAHALPAAFGNTGLFSNYECDACNHLFGEGIENHLGNWTKPMRTLSRIRGRSGVPTIKKPGAEKGWRVEYSGTGFQLKEYEDEPFFEVDEEAKQVCFELHRDTYIPVAALKGLVKIGLTLIPDVETQHFRETYQWIRDPTTRVTSSPSFRCSGPSFPGRCATTSSSSCLCGGARGLMRFPTPSSPSPMETKYCRCSCRRSPRTNVSTAKPCPFQPFRRRARPTRHATACPA